jgi:hypothetical protein
MTISVSLMIPIASAGSRVSTQEDVFVEPFAKEKAEARLGLSTHGVSGAVARCRCATICSMTEFVTILHSYQDVLYKISFSLRTRDPAVEASYKRLHVGLLYSVPL